METKTIALRSAARALPILLSASLWLAGCAEPPTPEVKLDTTSTEAQSHQLAFKVKLGNRPTGWQVEVAGQTLPLAPEATVIVDKAAIPPDGKLRFVFHGDSGKQTVEHTFDLGAPNLKTSRGRVYATNRLLDISYDASAMREKGIHALSVLAAPGTIVEVAGERTTITERGAHAIPFTPVEKWHDLPVKELSRGEDSPNKLEGKVTLPGGAAMPFALEYSLRPLRDRIYETLAQLAQTKKFLLPNEPAGGVISANKALVIANPPDGMTDRILWGDAATVGDLAYVAWIENTTRREASKCGPYPDGSFLVRTSPVYKVLVYDRFGGAVARELKVESPEAPECPKDKTVDAESRLASVGPTALRKALEQLLKKPQ